MLLLRQLHWLKVPWRIDYTLAVLVYKCLHGLVPSCQRTSPSSRVGVSKASAFRFVLWTVYSPVPYQTLNLRRPRISSRRCTDLEQSSTAYHICAVTSCLLLTLRHTSSNFVTHNYSCRAREVTLSFMDTLITLTYLLVRAIDLLRLILAMIHICAKFELYSLSRSIDTKARGSQIVNEGHRVTW